MSEFGYRWAELDPDSDIVIYCRVGERSALVTEFLLGRGFKKVRNLATGINGWSRDVDPSVRAY